MIVSSIVGATILPYAGCAALRRNGPVPEDVAACRELTQQGVAAMELGKWEKAEANLTKAVKASPADSTTRHYLAEVLWHRGATDDALVQMEAAVRLDPTDAALAVRSGEMQLTTGATEKSLERAEQAIRLNPKLPTAWALRGRTYWRMNQIDRALADLQRASQYAPDSPEILIDIATLYRLRGQNDRCLTTLHHLLDTYPPGQESQRVLWMEGLALADLGRPQQAATSLEAAIRCGPPNADILFYLAQARLAAGDPAAAASAAEEAVALNAGHEPSRRFLTQLATRPAPVEATIR